MTAIEINRQLRALEIAKILFEVEGYHTNYLEQIEQDIKLKVKGGSKEMTMNERRKGAK